MDLRALEERAKGVLTAQAYDYYAGGADDELTLQENEAAWSRMKLRPHVLRDVAVVDTRTTVLDSEVAMPILIAPTAVQRMAHPDGEIATARAAAATRTLMVVSTIASTSVGDVAEAAPDAPRWFQLYVRKDRGWAAELVQRAAAGGYSALVFTVDLPVLGHRRRDDRHPPGLPAGITTANMVQPQGGRLASTGSSWLDAAARDEFDGSLSFDDIGWLAGLSDLPVLVKGVLRADDARAAVDAGAAGVIVSNHGGRQLDTAVTGAEALPEVLDAVGDRVEVYVDGGIRRGTDVLKAVALGARAVLIGRPVIWALATGGGDGVQELLEWFQADLARAMALCGAARLSELEPDLVVLPR